MSKICINKLFFSNDSKNKISSDSPDWFKINSVAKMKEINNLYINNNSNLQVLSKFKSWITVTPKNKDRKRPLEKKRVVRIYYFIIF